MSNTIRTAISIQKPLFEQAEILAQRLNISKSHLVGIALEKFIHNYQNQNLLDQINKAYDDDDQHDENETIRLSKMIKNQKKLVEGDW
ncbi:MAG: hypothetical protein HQK72_14080 [Desulfamplus sp.]|nr:hypothetical protein [Desulfamplus sp.]